MFEPITTRFFVLDDNSIYVMKLYYHESSKKIYADAIAEFCEQEQLDILSHRFRCDDRLSIRVTEEERARIEEKYGNKHFTLGTPLGNLWVEFLKKKDLRRRFTPFPQLIWFMPWSMPGIRVNGFELGGHVYVSVDGKQVEDQVFPDWCKEITGEEFHRDYAKSRADQEKQ